MRINLILFFMLSMAVVKAQVVNDKLEAYFSFDNCKATDDSGNGSSGALKGSIGCDCGLKDSAMTFVDDNDAINLVGPFADVFSTSDFTVSFYFRPTPQSQQNASQLVMAKQDTCDLNHAFWVRYNDFGQVGTISSGISENDTLFTSVTAKLNANTCWQYITITRSNTTYSLYVNGELKDSKTTPVRIDLTNTTPLILGDPICPLDVEFKGKFDELRFHSKALNVDEIKRYNLRADEIITRDTLVYLGNSFQPKVTQFCVGQFVWSPLSGVDNPTAAQPIITPTQTTTYEITFNYIDGCEAIDTIHVTVIDPATLDCNEIFIPNAFTPTETPNLNDVFGISNPFAVDEFISFEVFDRWGGRVFSAETPFDSWDGNSNGKPANPGVFLYRLHYKCKGEEKVRAGSLTLLR
ncbi:MAG: gliding motility-associated C-terminal domain-containing protein [Saprospiraceae bacterium]|nr:gliding motility-associated C-terminal domain-containing protein [Saprospiraceae bacterium]